jgi:adenylate kinase
VTRGRTGNGLRPTSAAGITSSTTPRFFVMVGGPGAGKGTQAQRLATELSIPQVSSGDLFRAALESGTRLGRAARRYMDRGALVPDSVTVRMIAERLDQLDASAGAILDGFPRTVPQAHALDALLKKRGAHVEAALYIDVAPEELAKRLAGRWICRGAEQHMYHETNRPPLRPGICDIDGTRLHQRPDDRPATIRARLAEQLAPMNEVVDHYAERGVLVPVRGDRTVEDVTTALMQAIGRRDDETVAVLPAV